MSTTAIPAHEDPHISKEIRAFLKELNSGNDIPLEQKSPADARRVLMDAQNSVAFDYADIEEEEREIVQDDERMTVHIVRPNNGKREDLPVFMFFHGGGWVLGDYPTHRRLVRDLVVQSKAVAVFPDYTPSPEAKFPVAINQAYAATKWVAENGASIGVDSSRLAVVGNSVGGNMATVVALMAKDNNGPAIRYQVLLWPVTDADFSRHSYHAYGEERFLTTAMMQWMWDNYTTNPADRLHKYAAPIRATLAELKNLPPALIQVAENDILHDEAIAYGRKLDEAGVSVAITEYSGFIHDYGMLNPLAAVPAIQIAVQQAGDALYNALKKNKIS